MDGRVTGTEDEKQGHGRRGKESWKGSRRESRYRWHRWMIVSLPFGSFTHWLLRTGCALVIQRASCPPRGARCCLLGVTSSPSPLCQNICLFTGVECGERKDNCLDDSARIQWDRGTIVMTRRQSHGMHRKNSADCAPNPTLCKIFPCKRHTASLPTSAEHARTRCRPSPSPSAARTPRSPAASSKSWTTAASSRVRLPPSPPSRKSSPAN